jgi:hypothetical protein
VTRYSQQDWNSIPGRFRGFVSSPSQPQWFWGRPGFLLVSNGYWKPFSGWEEWIGMYVDTPPFTAYIKNVCGYIPFSHAENLAFTTVYTFRRNDSHATGCSLCYFYQHRRHPVHLWSFPSVRWWERTALCGASWPGKLLYQTCPFSDTKCFGAGSFRGQPLLLYLCWWTIRQSQG